MISKKSNMKKLFIEKFGVIPSYTVTSPGRFELLGNHTDHNGGLCLASACNLTINGFLSKRDDLKVAIKSVGYSDLNIDLIDLSINESEKFTSEALVRGVASYFRNKGYQIGGFNLVIESKIFKGAGVSSSAAYEVMIAQIFNVLFNEGKVSKIELAKAGQYAENIYFGKKSGLLDQSAIAFGNISFMDFKDGDNPIVNSISFPFNDVDVVIVNTGGSHADLSDLYSNIPLKMKSAAKKSGAEKLIESSKDKVLNNGNLDADEKDFSTHFYDENERVKKMVIALSKNDKKEFYKLIKESCESSTKYLRNMQVGDNYQSSPRRACDIVNKVVGDKGACKINGGGFAGSIVCFVDKDISDLLIEKMSVEYGSNNVKKISIYNNSTLVEKI